VNQQATFGMLLNANYNLAADTPITAIFTTYQGANETGKVTLTSQGTWDCTTGNPTTLANPINWTGSTTTFPTGFVLRTIICNTPVYERPGGQAVGNNAIRLGQTWFINPIPVKDAKGIPWTEIYVGSLPTVYIPTGCVR
jgi:hypothetical protein